MNYKLMFYQGLLSAGFLFILILSAGCSRSPQNPSFPDFGNVISDSENQFPETESYNAGRSLLEQWTVDFDPESMTATVTPDRESSARYKLTSLLPPPGVIIDSYNAQTNILRIQVTLKNITNLDAYDLRLIIYNSMGHELRNADGWTDLYDIPGGLPINPFMAYAKSDPERKFKAQSELTETLKIYCPSGNTRIKFAADIAYPTHSPEPYRIDNFYQEQILNDTGSVARIWIDVFDWQNDVNSVNLYCPEISGQNLVAFTGSGTNQYRLELINSTGAQPGDYKGVIVGFSGGSALYEIVTIHVYENRNTIGLINKLPGSFDGYTLFAPMGCFVTYLIDIDGQLVHSWQSENFPNFSVYLTENGHLLHTYKDNSHEGFGGMEEFDWDGNLVWKFSFPAGSYVTHHDIERLPNGNTLLIAWENKNFQECIDAGRDPLKLPENEMWPDTVIEIKQTGPESGDIVWEWHSWDHMSSIMGGTANGHPVSTDITDAGKLNINLGNTDGADWLHINAVQYNPQLDQIILSVLHFSELIIIDHKTADYDNPQAGIEAARGPAGDIIYRWGNPQSYGNGTESSRKLFHQHDCQWIAPGLPGEGNLLIFNNGVDRGYSSVDEIVQPVNPDGTYSRDPRLPFGPFSQEWVYTAENPADFMEGAISGAQRLPNGNTLICGGTTGTLFEVTHDNKIVWKYINPAATSGPMRQGSIPMYNSVFRCYRYAADYPAFTNRDLEPIGTIELP